MNKHLTIKFFLILTPIIIIGLFSLAPKYFPPKQTPESWPAAVNNEPAAERVQPPLRPPLSAALERVTKKPLGLYVSPKNSPVSPEKFTGYHTGVDFEITPDEENKDLTVLAVCAGKLLLKKSAAGYGGLAIESCKLNGQDITVVYGHLKLASVNLEVGQETLPGQAIGILGAAYSAETGGERKHLHLGIHRGAAINLLGYVQDKKLLDGWLNLLDYIK